MGTFFESAAVGTRTAFTLPGVLIQRKSYTTGAGSEVFGDDGSHSSDYTALPLPSNVTFDDIPWGGTVSGYDRPYLASGTVPINDFSSFQAEIDNATTAATARSGELDAAIAARDSAQDDLDAAQSSLDAVKASLESLQQAAFIARLGLRSAQAQNNAALIAEYTALSADADQAVAVKRQAVTTAQTARSTCATEFAAKQGQLDTFQGFDGGVRELLAAQLDYSIAQTLRGTLYHSDPTADPVVSDPYYNPYSTAGGAYVAEHLSYPLPAGAYRATYGKYRLSFVLTDGQHQQLADDGGSITIRWAEVTYEIGAPRPDNTGRYPDTVSDAEVKSEALSADDAEQMADGSERWFFTTDEYDVSVPAENTYVEIQGPEKLKNYTTIVSEVRGAEAFRQPGWHEFTTDPSAPYGRRYLTMTLSAASNAPIPNNYAGSYSLLDPNWTDVTDPGIVAVILAQALPDNQERVALNSDVLSPTSRVLHQPVGLQLTLSNEETPASIQAKVAASAVFDDEQQTGSIPNVFGAINDCPASGDYAAKQTLRYKVSYTTRAERGSDKSSFSDYFEITRKTTNLVTGHVTSEQIGFSPTFTYVPPYEGAPETGIPNTGFADTEWTVVGVPGGQTLIEVFGSESESIDATTHYGEPELSYGDDNS